METITKTADVSTRNQLVALEPANFPVEVTNRVRARGDLVNVGELTQKQIKDAEQIAAKFDISDTSATLRYAEDPQKRLTAFLRELMGDIRVRDAGIAGDLAKQMASGIDLMALAKVKKQIMNPPSHSFLAKLIRGITGYVNYIQNFYENQRLMRDLVDKMEAKANNRMASLDGHVKKLDRMAERTVQQIREQAPWIVAGEIILVRELRRYQEMREQVLQTKDVIAASALRDMARQIAAFEKRVLEVEVSYIEAGNIAIPQIRTAQEADRIEIQNTAEQILFQLPKFIRAVNMVAALADTKAAHDDRMIMEANQRQLDAVLDGAINEAARLAKESQGDPLRLVEELEGRIENMVQLINDGIEIENQTRAKREEAHQRLVALKDHVADALKGADLASAEAGY